MVANVSQVDAIFSAAIEIASADERAQYVAQACGEDAELRQRVESLLASHFEAGSFLESPPATVQWLQQEGLIEEGPSSVIGPYKLLQQIGEGGMGVVFMAEQTEPVHRTVALKIIKPGMDTRHVIARFEAERQALALMDHPNIARVLDAGTTGQMRSAECGVRNEEERGMAAETSPIPHSEFPIPASAGRPYFVMDLVKGVPITEYCDRQHLSIRERLELMTQVCHAVQHAHQKGIIHRDLKPSNVLVAEYDGKPVPKVIDFGVAKATAQKLTEKTMFTEFGQLIGTFEYMSPEQARFNQLDVDTRSDIYSLGVLLYELLAGSTPLEKERLRTAGFDEILRLIGEEEPPRPSLRLSSSQALPSISAQRQIEPAKLKKLVAGELDWIVMKALEKDRNRRYETASGLAMDLQRYFNDEPVEARAASQMYRVKKFIRRNKAGVLAGSAIVAALSVGLAASLYFAASASREAKAATNALEQAELHRKNAEGVNAFFTEEVFGLADPNRFDRAGIRLVEALDIAASKIDERFPDDPALRAVIRDRFGEIYRGADEPDKAVDQLQRAFELRRSIAGDHDISTLSSGQSLGHALYTAGRFSEAREILDATWADQCEQWGAGNRESLKTATTLCMVLMEIRARTPEAERDDRDLEISEMSFRQALAMLGPQCPETLDAQYAYAWVLRWRGLPDKALAPARDAATGWRRLKGESDVHTMFATYCYACCLHETGRFEEAVAELKPLLVTRHRVLGPTHMDTLFTTWRLAKVLHESGKEAEAIAVLDEVYARRDELRRVRSVRAGCPLHDIANRYILLGCYDRAADLLSIVYMDFMGPGTQNVGKEVYASWLNNLAATLGDSSQPVLRNGPRAVEVATRACELTEFTNSQFLVTLADAHAETREFSAAEKWFAKSLELSPDNAKAHSCRALLYLASEDLSGYRDACAAMSTQFAPSTEDDAQYLFAWTCGLGPAALGDLNMPIVHARDLVTNGPRNAKYLTAIGVLLYRAGKYEEGTEQLRASIAAYSKDLTGDGTPIYPQFFLAMTEWQLGHKAAASRLLTDAQKSMDSVMESPPAWSRRSTLELFRREAEALIQPVEPMARSKVTDSAARR